MTNSLFICFVIWLNFIDSLEALTDELRSVHNFAVNVDISLQKRFGEAMFKVT